MTVTPAPSPWRHPTNRAGRATSFSFFGAVDRTVGFRSKAGALTALALFAAGSGFSQPTPLHAPPRITPPATAADAADAGDSPAIGVISGDYTLQQREARLEALLNTSVADGSLSRDEFALASQGLANIRAAEDRARGRNHGQLTDTDTFRLEGHLRSLAASIRWKP